MSILYEYDEKRQRRFDREEGRREEIVSLIPEKIKSGSFIMKKGLNNLFYI